MIFSSVNLIEHKVPEGECLGTRLERLKMWNNKVPTKPAQFNKVSKWIWTLFYRQQWAYEVIFNRRVMWLNLFLGNIISGGAY